MKIGEIDSVFEKRSGEPCFVGTRVPLSRLFATLTSGESYKDFLEDFPGVSEEQVLAVLRESEKRLLDEFETLQIVKENQEILLCQRSGLAHVLGLMLAALPNEKGEHLTVQTAHRFVKESLENGRLLEVDENTKY